MILKFSEFLKESLNRNNSKDATRFMKLIDEPFKVYHDKDSDGPDGVVDFGKKGHFFYGFDPVSSNPNGSNDWPLWLFDYYESEFNPTPNEENEWVIAKDGGKVVQDIINALS